MTGLVITSLYTIRPLSICSLLCVSDPGVHFICGLSDVSAIISEGAELTCKLSSEDCEGAWFRDGKKVGQKHETSHAVSHKTMSKRAKWQPGDLSSVTHLWFWATVRKSNITKRQHVRTKTPLSKIAHFIKIIKTSTRPLAIVINKKRY